MSQGDGMVELCGDVTNGIPQAGVCFQSRGVC